MGKNKNLINSTYKTWRNKEPLCGILNEWYGRYTASRIINKLATQPVHISEPIDELLKDFDNPERLEFERIKLFWQEIVPAAYSDCSFPYYIKRNILHVKVKDSCSMMELNMIKNKLLKDLQEKLNNRNIQKIIFEPV